MTDGLFISFDSIKIAGLVALLILDFAFLALICFVGTREERSWMIWGVIFTCCAWVFSLNLHKLLTA